MARINEYCRWDGVEAASLVRSGDVTASELADAARVLADELIGLNAVAGERVPTTATATGEFAGVPSAVKELLAFPGLAWTFGSRLLATQPAPPEPTPYAAKLIDLGLGVLWSTTSSEFGLLGSTESALHGVTANPWARGLSAAGSSGGSAALVAAGIVPIAHGSDAGGSLRVPASVTGTFGFKPSRGRCVPGGAEADTGLAALLSEHVITRSVRDSAVVLAATERTDAAAPLPPVGRLTHGGSPPLRIGVLRPTLTGRSPDKAVEAVLDETVALCASLGHHLFEVAPPPADGHALSDAFFTAAAVTIGQVASMVTGMRGAPPGPEELEPFTLELLARSGELPPDAGARAAAVLATEAAAYSTVFERCDVVLTPTLATLPWPIGHLAPDLGYATLVARTEEAVGYTPVHNAAGCPAMSVPLGEHDGLPVGMHFAARLGGDATLLRLAFDLEAAAPWAHRHPDTSWLVRSR
jgi:amidase